MAKGAMRAVHHDVVGAVVDEVSEGADAAVLDGPFLDVLLHGIDDVSDPAHPPDLGLEKCSVDSGGIGGTSGGAI